MQPILEPDTEYWVEPVSDPGFFSVCEVISVGPAENCSELQLWVVVFFTEQSSDICCSVNIAGNVLKTIQRKILYRWQKKNKKLHYILVGANPSCTVGWGYIAWCCQDESSAVWGVVKAPELFKAVGCVVLQRPSQASAVLKRQNQVGREHLMKMQWKSASILMVH